MIRTVCAIAAAAMVFAAHAGATPVDDYTIDNAERVCTTLDEVPTFNGVFGIGKTIVEETEYSYEQSGQIIARAVIGWCPRHQKLLQDFIASAEKDDDAVIMR